MATARTTSGVISFQGGTVEDGTLVESGTSDFDGQAGTVSADLSGSVGLTKTTAGTLVLSGSNTYTAGTTVTAGILEATDTDTLPGYGTANQLSIAGGATVAILVGGEGNWSDEELADLLANPSLTRGNLAVDVADNSSFEYSAAIVGNCNITKIGEGELTLSGTNTYTGGTTIKAGTLVVGSSSALGNSTNGIIVTGGALDLSNHNISAGAVVLVDGSIIGTGKTLTASSYTVASGTISVNLAGSAAWPRTPRARWSSTAQLPTPG